MSDRATGADLVDADLIRRTASGDRDAFAESNAEQAPSSRVRAAVLRAWDEHHAPTPARIRRWLAAAATAAALLMFTYTANDDARSTAAVSVPSSRTVTMDAPPEPATNDATPPAPGAPRPRARTQRRPLSPAPGSEANATAAVVLVGAPPVPGERLQFVRTRIAHEALLAMGVGHARTEADMVDIDVLVGEDGVARGFRIASIHD